MMVDELWIAETNTVGLATSNTFVPGGYKQTDVGVFPENWDVVELRTLVDETRSIRYGIVQPGKYDPKGRLMIRGQDYSRGWVDSDEMFRVADTIEARYRNARLRSGDLIITIVGAGTGYVEMVPEWLDGANLTQTTARIAIDECKADRYYCMYVLQSRIGARQVESFIKGGAQPGLNCGDVERFQVNLAPLQEQRAIATALSDADALIASLDKLIAKKRDMKAAAMQQLLTGRERLPGSGWSNGYQYTEIGKIPKDWEISRISDVSEVKTGPFGASLHERDYVDSGTPIVTVEHLGEHGIVHNNLPMVSDVDRRRLKAYSLNEGDIVFSRVGSVDRNALIGPQEKGWLFSGRLLRVRVNRLDVSSLYLSYHFHSEPFKQRVRTVSVGQTMASLNTQLLKAIPVIIPPLEEQRAIAAVLSDMDAEITALEARRDKTRAIKQGMMQELLTGKTRLL